MKLSFLGTAHVPYGYKKSDMLSTALLIDERLLVQPNEDIYLFTERYALPELTENIHTVFVTCSHPRAFSPATIERLTKQHPLRLLASDAVVAMCRHIEGVQAIPLRYFRTVMLDGMRITPLSTGYTTTVCAENCFTARIESGDRALYFGIPGGYPTEETVQFLKEQPVDCAILDISHGMQEADRLTRHLSLDGACDVRDRLVACGALRGRAHVMLSALPAFPDFEEKNRFIETARANGFLVPYDGYFFDL